MSCHGVSWTEGPLAGQHFLRGHPSTQAQAWEDPEGPNQSSPDCDEAFSLSLLNFLAGGQAGRLRGFPAHVNRTVQRAGEQFVL